MNEVKKPKKPMFFYYIIVLMAILLFNSLAMPMITENKIKEVDYGTFISMTESGKVKKLRYRSSRTRSCSLVKKMTRYTRPPWWTTPILQRDSTMQAFRFQVRR